MSIIEKIKAVLDPRGHEILDDTPVAIPLNKLRKPTQIEEIRRLIQQEVSRAAVDQGIESFEEADDFDVGDDYDPSSPYEMLFEPEPPEQAPDADPTPAPAPEEPAPEAGPEGVKGGV